MCVCVCVCVWQTPFISVSAYHHMSPCLFTCLLLLLVCFICSLPCLSFCPDRLACFFVTLCVDTSTHSFSLSLSLSLSLSVCPSLTHLKNWNKICVVPLFHRFCFYGFTSYESEREEGVKDIGRERKTEDKDGEGVVERVRERGRDRDNASGSAYYVPFTLWVSSPLVL